MRRTALYLSMALAFTLPTVALGQVVDLDAEHGAHDDGVDAPPAVPGQPTQEAANAKKLFEMGNWSDAAIALKRVMSGETGDDQGNRELAQYQLAISLYNLDLFVASYAQFAEIAARKNHQKFAETLLWIARLATKLPDVAGVAEAVHEYDRTGVTDSGWTRESRAVRWQLGWVMGRHAFDIGDLDEAISLFQGVDRASPYHAIANFYAGLAFVRLRQGVAARERFEAARDAIAAATEPRTDALADLTTLNLARVNYALAFRQRREGDFEASTKLIDAAIGYWDAIPVTSPFRVDAYYERGRAHFAIGDFGAALGDLESARSPLVQHAGFVQADAFEVEIYGSLCDRPAVATLRANLQANYAPLRDGLREYAAARSSETGEEELYRDFSWLVRKPGTDTPKSLASLSGEVRADLERVVSKRELTHHLDWIERIDADIARFKRQTEGFRSSSIGADVLDVLDLQRQIAIRNAGARVLQRIEERVAELEGAFQFAETIAKYTHAPVANPAAFHVDRSSVTDESGEYERWPVDGEVWADEIGTYRAVVVSKCPRDPLAASGGRD